MSTSLIDRAKATGKCPPSLLQSNGFDNAQTAFENAVEKVLDANG
eukprot:CAMPEP_0198133232 /NCGR_PEP_ID=MMETSP1442-20131203/59459_1 /TAXON_ID= /ORGANISM="Craspedostauros australis, Strain CCMP3328" /LENGTH=44 /DNA_ID= /DNA_START= /DNA_END= /DNA_ORIENTATION=